MLICLKMTIGNRTLLVLHVKASFPSFRFSKDWPGTKQECYELYLELDELRYRIRICGAYAMAHRCQGTVMKHTRRYVYGTVASGFESLAGPLHFFEEASLPLLNVYLTATLSD